MDAETDSGPAVVKASDDPTSPSAQLPNGSYLDEEKPAEDCVSSEEPVMQEQEAQNKEQQETEAVVSAESELLADSASGVETELEKADCESEEELEQPSMDVPEPNDEGAVQLHQEEAQEELAITVTETSETLVIESGTDVAIEPVEARTEDVAQEPERPEEPDVLPVSDSDAHAIDEAESTEEAANEANETEVSTAEPENEETPKKVDVESEAETVLPEKAENEEVDSNSTEKVEEEAAVQEAKEEAIESSDTRQPPAEAAEATTLEPKADEPAGSKIKPPSRKRAQRKRSPRRLHSRKEEVAAASKTKRTPTMPKRATAIPVPSKTEHEEASGSAEHKTSAPVRRTSAARTTAPKQQQQHQEEAKDAKSSASPLKSKPTAVRKPAAATEEKDGDEKPRRSITSEKPAATTREKVRVSSAADATVKTTRTAATASRRATVGDAPTASAAGATCADSASTAAASQSSAIQAAKADELRRSNSSQLSKTESGGSSEVFPDGSGASAAVAAHPKYAAEWRSNRLRQAAAACKKLQEEANKALEASNENQYLTPLQRKESEVKELRRLLQEAYQDISMAVKDKEEFIAELQAEIDQLTLDYQALTALHGEVKRREEELEREVARLRQEMEEREQRHQQYYLEMYRKGQESAKFERQDELEKLAVQEPDKVSIDELVEKLELTQQDLHKWQTLKLMETYSESEQPATEADARLRFLRDSMFHYLTEKDRDQGLQHLKAIIGIFNFTEVQMATIMKSLSDRKKRGKI
uniref:GRIP domain-containing protein n=1 Tax=Macrostomum lignano TaxID=282301 RepID=A0A1I8I8L4_9PLAT